jgi:diaminopimelate decarboxylase
MNVDNKIFTYKSGVLHWHNQSISELITQYKTPFYVYAKAQLQDNYNALRLTLDNYITSAKNSLICYAVKANSNLAILKLFFAFGAYFDTVSQGEIFRCLQAGIPGERIIFAGVGKTSSELEFAIDNKIKLIVVESLPELELLNNLATKKNTKVDCLLRLNPDIDFAGDKKIRTSHRDDKFGIDFIRAGAIIRNIDNYGYIELQGFSVHVGSQICELSPFEQAFTKVQEFIENNFPNPKFLNFGGGIGINYNDNATIDLSAYATLLNNVTKATGAKNIMIEPGRFLVANAGLLISQITYVKHSIGKTFLIMDASMNDFPRPSLYGAKHEIMPVSAPFAGMETESDILFSSYEVVGSICESSDVLARDCILPPVVAGQALAFRDAGAYSAVMSSNYNSRPKCAEVMINNGKHMLIHKPQELAQMIANEVIPEWIAV